jgi:HemK-like putative methylase
MKNRPETEAYIVYLAQLIKTGILNPGFTLKSSKKPLKIVDLCSGTGCIPLLLHSILSATFPDLSISGWDISPIATSLARDNLRHAIKQGHLRKPARVNFEKVDIFSDLSEAEKQVLNCDVLVSNPPYISEDSFNHDTARSVRNWEPRLALVPLVPNIVGVAPEDVFYDRLMYFYLNVSHSKILLMEVGDDRQAARVAQMALDRVLPFYWPSRVEIWRDWPEQSPEIHEAKEVTIEGHVVPVIGSGKLRSVVVFSLPKPPEDSSKTGGPAERKDDIGL